MPALTHDKVIVLLFWRRLKVYSNVYWHPLEHASSGSFEAENAANYPGVPSNNKRGFNSYQLSLFFNSILQIVKLYFEVLSESNSCKFTVQT